MKTLFSLVIFVPGSLVLMIGLGNLLFLTHNPATAAAGGVATVVGLTFLWLATEAMFSKPQK